MEKERKKDTVTNMGYEEDTMIYDTRKSSSFLNDQKGVFDLRSTTGINSQKSIFDSNTVFNTRR